MIKKKNVVFGFYEMANKKMNDCNNKEKWKWQFCAKAQLYCNSKLLTVGTITMEVDKATSSLVDNDFIGSILFSNAKLSLVLKYSLWVGQ